jgi:hypothetical protein
MASFKGIAAIENGGAAMSEALLAKEAFVPLRARRDWRFCLMALVAIGATLIWLSGYKREFAFEQRVFPPIRGPRLVPFANRSAGPDDLVMFVFNASKHAYQKRLAATIAVGLLNRAAEMGKPAAYSLLRNTDNHWLNETLWQSLRATAASQNGAVVLVDTSMEQMVGLALERGLIKAKVVYNDKEEVSLNTVVSVAAVRDAIALPADFAPTARLLESDARIAALPLALDARGKWRAGDYSGQVDYLIDNVLAESNKLHIAYQVPSIVSGAWLVDHLVSEKIVSFWLENVCAPWSDDKRQFNRLMQNNPHWSTERPLSVMGYVPGFFEAVGTCSERRSEVAFVSDFLTGVSALSKVRKFEDSKHPPMQPISYDPRKKYVMMLTSDGDNIAMVLDTILYEFRKKQQLCDRALELGLDMDRECPRQTWTMNGRLKELAPNVLEYFYQAAKKHGRDAFMNGPCGYGYLYPALIADEEDARKHAQLTDMVAQDTNQTAYAHWDWAMTFPGAINYMRRFAGTSIEGIFIAVVPSFLPLLSFRSEDVLQDPKGDVQIFTEQLRWAARGDYFNGKGWEPERVAAFFNSRAEGSLTYAYKIHDRPHEDVVAMARALDSDVVLVDYKQLIDLRKQKTKLEGYPTNSSFVHLGLGLAAFFYALFLIKRYY